MYISYQLLHVHHDEWLRRAETRRMIKQAASAMRASSPRSSRFSFRRRPLRVGRLVSQG